MLVSLEAFFKNL